MIPDDTLPGVKANFTFTSSFPGYPARVTAMPKRTVETSEYLKAAARFIRAAGRRCADADELELSELIALQAVLDEAVQGAVDGIRGRGNSWSYVALATGKSREAAYQRWGKK